MTGSGRVEVDGAAAHALAVEDHRQLAHQLEDVDQPVVVLAQRGIAFEDEIDVGVGHALGGADDALAERVADDLALMIDLHHAGQHHAIDLRAQAAHVGGKLDGQHGDGAIGKVDRRAAQARFEIDGRVLANVMRDVGDVDLELEVAVRHAADGDRIVEVARGFAVDGDDGQRAEVAAMAQLAGGDHRVEVLRFLQDFDREAMRQVKLADDDLDVDAEVVFVAENFEDAAARVLGRRGPVGDLDFDDYTFEVGPFATTRFGAEDAILLSHPLAKPGRAGWGTRACFASGWVAPSFPRFLSGRAGIADGHSDPRGMMICCVTFSSMGVT